MKQCDLQPKLLYRAIIIQYPFCSNDRQKPNNPLSTNCHCNIIKEMDKQM